MGLGKTLSMIALIASDLDRNSTCHPSPGRVVQADILESTLVVVPPNRKDWRILVFTHNS